MLILIQVPYLASVQGLFLSIYLHLFSTFRLTTPDMFTPIRTVYLLDIAYGLVAACGLVSVVMAELWISQAGSLIVLLLFFSFLTGYIQPRLSWLSGILFGLSIFLVRLALHFWDSDWGGASVQHGPLVATTLVALFPSLIGSYAGMSLRSAVQVLSQQLDKLLQPATVLNVVSNVVSNQVAPSASVTSPAAIARAPAVPSRVRLRRAISA